MASYRQHFMIKSPELKEKAKAVIDHYQNHHKSWTWGWVIKAFLNCCWCTQKLPILQMAYSGSIYKFWAINMSRGTRKREGNQDYLPLTWLPYKGLIEFDYYWILGIASFVQVCLILLFQKSSPCYIASRFLFFR